MNFCKLFLGLLLLIIKQCCLANEDENEYEKLYQRWQQEREIARKEWEMSLSFSSRGPNDKTKSYYDLLGKSVKLLPFLLKRINAKRNFDEYCQSMNLFASIMKIRFEGKYIKGENKILLSDYDIKYIPRITMKNLGKEQDFVFEYELWWKLGRKKTPEVFARKYREYVEARQSGQTDAISQAFERLQNMGIIILPNILEKMEGGDESLLPMFVYLSGVQELKTVADCRTWWDKNREDFKEILDY